jgi:hypothetical protein
VAPALAGCSGPKEPQGEIVGSTGIAFAYRPLAAQKGTELIWTTRVANQENTTSAPATLHLAIKSSRTALVTESSAPIAALPPRGSAEVQARTPYDGIGDYSGTAEIRVGARVVARAVVFFEQCQLC